MIDYRILFHTSMGFVWSMTAIAMVAGTYYSSAILWLLSIPCMIMSIYMAHLACTDERLSP